MADLDGNGVNIDGGGIDGGGETSSRLHLTYTAQLFSEPMRRGEVQTWEGEEDDILDEFRELKVGVATTRYMFITAANETWGTPFIAGVQAPRRSGKTWTMQVTVVQLRKCVLWTLDFAEIQKDIRTWRQNIEVADSGANGGANGGDGGYVAPDLSILAQWERAKDIQDWENYDSFKTVDGVALTGNTLELAQMIRKGIESYTIHTPVPTMTMRYFDEVEGTGALLDKYLDDLPSGPSGWHELGGAGIYSQLSSLKEKHVSGEIGTIQYKWLCVTDKSTPNGDGSSTRIIQFMRVDNVEEALYDEGQASDGGLDEGGGQETEGAQE